MLYIPGDRVQIFWCPNRNGQRVTIVGETSKEGDIVRVEVEGEYDSQDEEADEHL